MSRVQLALNVSNLNEAIEFYSKMFNTKPAKVREGYANFVIAEPPLKLVLMERAAGDTSEFHHLNHHAACSFRDPGRLPRISSSMDPASANARPFIRCASEAM